ncbi:hypothetical protein KTGMC3_P1210 [Methanocalculus sp. MC3]
MTNAGIGAISYEDSGFVIPIDLNEGADILVQIMIYDVGGLHQEEEQLILESVSISPDQFALFIPAPLPEGSYKAHITLFQNEKRLAGRILDFHVQ